MPFDYGEVIKCELMVRLISNRESSGRSTVAQTSADLFVFHKTQFNFRRGNNQVTHARAAALMCTYWLREHAAPGRKLEVLKRCDRRIDFLRKQKCSFWFQCAEMEFLRVCPPDCENT